MKVKLLYGRDEIELSVPDDAVIYKSRYPEKKKCDSELVLESVRNPVASKPLTELLKKRSKGEVAVVVSDITRPIPYSRFLPELLREIESANVAKKDIVIIVATGMHRFSTFEERIEMFGKDIVGDYMIIDHDAESESGLVELPGKSWSGSRVKINRRFAEAGFKITTGLVEPHFMAGFSGGRKAVCPGLSSLETVRKFHGYEFLSSPLACNGNLKGNPCHLESLSVAKLAKVDFSLNVILNNERQLVKAFAGGLDEAHLEACEFVSGCSCPKVVQEADIAVTSCGGYPLDATFYQCVKGIVSCLPAVKENGTVISFGSCLEGVGGPEYHGIMVKYSGRWRDFLRDIRDASAFIKDQWEMQMHCRALEKVGEENLHFMTGGLPKDTIAKLSVNGAFANNKELRETVQGVLDGSLKKGMKVAIFPEGPYCAPVKAEGNR
ncbi:MAG: nickel-dependent lactate racemase [Victivallales bacterium]